MATREDTNKALNGLTDALSKNTKSQMGLFSPLDNLKNNFGTASPLIKTVNNLIDSMASIVSPSKNLSESMQKSDELQKRMLGSNSNLTNFIDKNSKTIEGLKGGFFENAEELFANFEEGLRFNSESLNTLQNRMKLTGQSTDQLRKTTKTLLEVTNNDIDAVGRLSKTNQDLGRTYMVTNDKLLQALDRNSEMLDFASLFDEGEQTSKAVMDLTARLTSKGVAVDKQQTIIKFLGDQSLETVQMRQRLGISVDVLDKIATGQTSLDTVLNQINDYSKQNLITAQGDAKGLKTKIAFEGLGQGIEQVVTASKQIGAALNRSNKETVDNRSKEDKFYDTFETARLESKNFYDKTVTEFYDVMKPTPETLKMIHGALIGGMLGGVIGKATEGITGKILSKLGPKIGPAAGAAAAVPAQAVGKAATTAATAATKAVGGGLLRSAIGLIGGASRFLGPIGMIAGTFGPMLFDYLASSDKKTVDMTQATNDLNKSVAESNNNLGYLKNITSADEGVNKERTSLITNQTDTINKIDQLIQSLQSEGDEELIAQVKNDAANHIKKLNSIADQGKKANLTQQQLHDLNEQAKLASDDFSKKIQENTKITAEKTAILAKDKEPKPEEKIPKKRETLEDLLHKALGTALSRSIPKKDESTEQMKKLLEESNKTQSLLLDQVRRNPQWAGA